MSKYRQGTLEKAKTAKGLVWYLRYTDSTGAKQVQAGKPARPRVRIGLVADMPSKSAARRAAEPILRRLNAIAASHRATFGDLLDKYEDEAMPPLAWSTRRGYQSIINAHIRPRWGATPIEEVHSYETEVWLLSKKCGNVRKGHIHGLMKVLFRFAMHTRMLKLEANPMHSFAIRGGTKRAKEPGTITHTHFHALLELLGEPYRTMVVIAMCLGLRVSEIMGLQWHDFDFLAGEVKVQRAVVEGHEGEVKTYHSKKKLSLHPRVISAIQMWRSQTEFTEPEQFIFASPWQAGELPYNSSKIQSDILREAGNKIGLDFSLGWHTLRHSYRVLLRKSGAAMDVQRDLMRHANIGTTMQTYGGTELNELRKVNDEVVDSLFGERKQ